jgi:hypothetical protein
MKHLPVVRSRLSSKPMNDQYTDCTSLASEQEVIQSHPP